MSRGVYHRSHAFASQPQKRNVVPSVDYVVAFLRLAVLLPVLETVIEHSKGHQHCGGSQSGSGKLIHAWAGVSQLNPCNRHQIIEP